MQFLKKHYISMLIIILPIIILTISLGVLGIGVNSNYSMFTLDFKHQYMNFFQFYRENLFTNPSRLIYYQGLGLGNETFGLFNYYLASPINLILFLFPKNMLEHAVYTIILIKFILGGFSFKYLINSFNIANKYKLILILSYMFSGYFIFNFINLIWLDVLYLLPLMIVGIDKLFSNGNKKLFVFSTSLMIFCNFYIGYILCLTSFIYFIYRLLSNKINEININYKKVIFDYILSAVFIVLTSITTLYTSYLSMSMSKGINGDSIFETFFKQNFNFIDFISKLIVGSNGGNQISKGEPNIWIPSILIVIALFMFISNSFSLKDKLLKFSTLFVIYFIFSTNGINLIFHGFSQPIWFLYRNSFIFIIFILLFIAEFISRFDVDTLKLDTRNKLILLFAVLFISGIMLMSDYLSWQKYVTIGFLLINYTVFVFGGKYIKYPIITVIVLLEIAINSLLFIFNNYTLDVIAPHKSFTEYSSEVSQVQEELNDYNLEGYRFDKNYRYTYQEGINNGFSNTEGFSSNLNSGIIPLLSNLGLYTNSNMYRTDTSTLFINDYLGVKYYSHTKQDFKKFHELAKYMTDFDDYTFYDRYLLTINQDVINNYKKIGETEHTNLYENQNTLGKFYLSNDTKGVTSEIIEDDFLENQNKLYKNIFDTDENIFSKLDIYYDKKLSEGIDEINIDPDSLDDVTFVNTKDTKKLVYNIYSETDNNLVYFGANLEIAESTVENTNRVKTTINGKVISNNLLESAYLKKGNNQLVFDISYLNGAETSRYRTYNFEPYAYSLDVDKLNKSIENKNSSEEIIVNEHNKSNRISITINKNKNNYKVIKSTIPYDSNWKATFDYQILKVIDVDGFLAIENTEPFGSGTIELDYHIPHAIPIFIFNIVFIILVFVIDSKKFKFKKDTD